MDQEVQTHETMEATGYREMQHLPTMKLCYKLAFFKPLCLTKSNVKLISSICFFLHVLKTITNQMEFSLRFILLHFKMKSQRIFVNWFLSWYVCYKHYKFIGMGRWGNPNRQTQLELNKAGLIFFRKHLLKGILSKRNHQNFLV